MERLQKVIANAGVCSRRKAEELIKEGKVKVNGNIVTELGIKVSDSDSINVAGTKLKGQKSQKKHYYLMFKPKSVISSTSDEHDRLTVVDLIEEKNTRVYPVGRLDFDTTGLILLTNDGEFANKMMHPSSKIPKTYIVYADGVIDNEQKKLLENGVVFDGRKSAKAKVKVMDKDFKHSNCKVSLTIIEGRNHQVKKMFDAVGLHVRKLHRASYGHLNLNGLVPGQYRKLKFNEVQELLELAEFGYLDY